MDFLKISKSRSQAILGLSLLGFGSGVLSFWFSLAEADALGAIFLSISNIIFFPMEFILGLVNIKINIDGPGTLAIFIFAGLLYFYVISFAIVPLFRKIKFDFQSE